MARISRLSSLGMFLFVTLLPMGCSGPPERFDNRPYVQSEYQVDDSVCRSEVKQRYPRLDASLQFGNVPPSGPLSLAYSEYHNCMLEKGWKNF